MVRSSSNWILLIPTLCLCASFAGCSGEKSEDRAANRAVSDHGDGENPVVAVTPFDTADGASPALDDSRSGEWRSAAETMPIESAVPVEPEATHPHPLPPETVRQPVQYKIETAPLVRAPIEKTQPFNPLRHRPAPVDTTDQPMSEGPYRRMLAEPSTNLPRPTDLAVEPLRSAEVPVRPMTIEAPRESVTAARELPAHLARIAPPPPAPAADMAVEPRASEGTVLRLVPRDVTPPPSEPASRVAEAPATTTEIGVAHDHQSHASDDAVAADPVADSPSPADEPFHRVTVFYGTDRASLTDVERGRRDYLHWLQWTAIALAGTVCLGLLNLRASAGRGLKILFVTAVLSTCGLGGWSAVRWLQYVPPDEQPRMAYGGDRGALVFGTCDVSIPKHHEVGQLEAPSLLRVEFQADPEKHVAVLEAVELPEGLFYEQLRQRVADSSAKQAFVFVHGYNVSFDDAVRRTAQLAFDLKFDGAPICYSWPSQAEYLGYSTDEDNVIWTESDLERFLLGVQAGSGAERIHLIAHSMGNRALTSVLRSFSRDLEGGEPLFDEVVLTAPDIDADHFRRNLAPAIVKTARRVTLYASSNDEALAMSKKFHGGHPRAGESGPNIVVLPEIDTIDVSAVDTSLVGHSYYGDNTTVLADLFHVFEHGCGPEERAWLTPQPFDDMRYWVFLAERMGTRPADERR